MPPLVRCAINTSVDSIPSCRSTSLTSASSSRANVRSVRTMSLMRGAQLAERFTQIVDEAVAIDEDARGGEELDAVDRLAQVVVDAGGQAGDAEGRVAARGGDDDRRALVVAAPDQAPHQLEAVR